MTSILQRFQWRAGISLSALMLVSGALGASGSANAQTANDAEVRALRAQVEQLQRAVNQLTAGQEKSTTDAKVAREQASEAKAKAAQAHAEASKAQANVNANAALVPATKASSLEIDANGHTYLEHKKGNPLTFYTPGGEITAYGNFDISIDGTTKSLNDVNSGNFQLNGSSPPVGNFGWLAAISTNLSYLGVRGFQRVPNFPLNFVYQVELGFDISATPGLRQTNSNLSDTVNGTLFNRNTYIGFASPEFGAIKIGKTDAPYKLSTGGFNPFSGQIGDYSVIMGNSGGDNRVEFGTRLDHSVWYESPVVSGFQFNALFSPGQNRDNASGNIPAGSSDCSGGNDPLSGGLAPQGCNDGGFSNVVSTNLSYTNGGLYATVAYEFHERVNRQSDITGIYGVTQNFGTGGAANTIGDLTFPNANSRRLFNEDVANEDAFKVGVLYNFPTKTTVGAIWETMHRYVVPELQFQNERQRQGTWFFVSQQLTDSDSVHFGWAHAFHTPGDIGQHNTAGQQTTPDGAGVFANNDNAADMITASYKRKFGSNLTWYTAVAATFNHPDAHYDLGAGGRGVTTDCHDAFAASGGVLSVPHCFAGPILAGVSTGIQWRF